LGLAPSRFAVLKHREIPPQRPDWLADEAVLIAPCLRAKFPENRELNREFAKIHGFLAMQGAEEAGIFKSLAVNSLLAPEQGICEPGTGNCFGGTGNLSRGSGKFLELEMPRLEGSRRAKPAKPSREVLLPSRRR
jgi:hypothetical protein